MLDRCVNRSNEAGRAPESQFIREQYEYQLRSFDESAMLYAGASCPLHTKHRRKRWVENLQVREFRNAKRRIVESRVAASHVTSVDGGGAPCVAGRMESNVVSVAQCGTLCNPCGVVRQDARKVASVFSALGILTESPASASVVLITCSSRLNRAPRCQAPGATRRL